MCINLFHRFRIEHIKISALLKRMVSSEAGTVSVRFQFRQVAFNSPQESHLQ